MCQYSAERYHLNGFSKLLRFDRNRYERGAPIYSNENTTNKELKVYKFPAGHEGIIIEGNACGFCLEGINPHPKTMTFFLDCISKGKTTIANIMTNLCLQQTSTWKFQNHVYHTFLIPTGQRVLSKTRLTLRAVSIRPVLTFFKKNSPLSFQTTQAVAAGLSDFHKQLVSAYQVFFQKYSPRTTTFRYYKSLIITD